MTQVTRAQHATDRNSKIASLGRNTAQDVREVIEDLEDSVSWNTPGIAPPDIAPEAIGDLYTDAQGGRLYFAKGVSDQTDYVPLAVLTDLQNFVESDPEGISGAEQITNMVSLTQAQYDALGTYDENTFYVIQG